MSDASILGPIREEATTCDAIGMLDFLGYYPDVVELTTVYQKEEEVVADVNTVVLELRMAVLSEGRVRIGGE